MRRFGGYFSVMGTCWEVHLFSFFKIEVWLIYSIVLISGVQQSDSVLSLSYIYICIYIFIFLFIFFSIIAYNKILNTVPCATQ